MVDGIEHANDHVEFLSEIELDHVLTEEADTRQLSSGDGEHLRGYI